MLVLVPVTLFNVIALLLVLGIGVGYDLFIRQDGVENASTLLAIAPSAMITILVFGLLAFSDTVAIHVLGIPGVAAGGYCESGERWGPRA